MPPNPEYLYAHESLGAYAQTFFPDIQLSDHHQKIIKALLRVESGKCSRLMIVAPPRHGKSTLVAEFFPAWSIGRIPSRQIIYATYGQRLSSHFGKKVKDCLTSDKHPKIFPTCHIREDSQATDRVETYERGAYIATSIGGAVTGKGADILIIDDPVKDRSEAESELMRDNCWDWYISTARTRLMPGGSIILILTRWHEDDLAGRLLMDSADEWEVLHLMAENQGKALWPEWFPIEELRKIKKDLGTYEFEALYQGRPSPLEGGLFKVEKFRYYKPDDLPPPLSSAHRTPERLRLQCLFSLSWGSPGARVGSPLPSLHPLVAI